LTQTFENPASNRAPDAAPAPGDDTVRLPWDAASERWDTVVRPVLAVLFRLALGPAADSYAPRFLRYERRGGAPLSWHWPAFLFGSAWAFYRKLWAAGIAFAALPLLGAAGFGLFAPALDRSTLGWLACALASVWLAPGVVTGLLANRVLYAHVRRRVALAEASAPRADEAAARISAWRPTSTVAALVLGAVAAGIGATAVAPFLGSLYHDRVVRVSIAERLMALRPLERAIEEAWRRGVSLAWLAGTDSAGTLDERAVRVSPQNGRVRVDLGAWHPELQGKSILLAPAVDPEQRVRWICVPVDVPRKYLPPPCA
jgi:hypothetical protein